MFEALAKSQEKVDMTRKTSATKNSLLAKKMRPISVEQLSHLPEILRFKLIGRRLHID